MVKYRIRKVIVFNTENGGDYIVCMNALFLT